MEERDEMFQNNEEIEREWECSLFQEITWRNNFPSQKLFYNESACHHHFTKLIHKALEDAKLLYANKNYYCISSLQ